jgi:hypothetical protein
MVTVLRPLSTSELLDRTFHLYKNNFWLFVGIAAVPQLFVLLLQFVVPIKPDPQHFGAMMLKFWTVWVVLVVGALVAQAATAVAVSELHLDRAASIRNAYSTAAPSVLRVIWVALVAILVPVLIALPIGLVIGMVLGLLAGGIAAAGGGSNLLLIRMTALLTPLVILLVGLRWWLRWSLIVPVTVLEKTGLRATLRRSKELTKGRRLGIFGIYILIILLGIVVAWLIQTPLLLVTGFRSLRDPYHVNTGAQVASFVGQFVSSSLVGGLATIALTLIYYDQRVRKEGFDLQLMMAALQPESRPPAAAATASN